MPATYFNFVEDHRCERGSTFRKQLLVYDGLTAQEQYKASQGQSTSAMVAKLRDLTGFTARMQIRSERTNGTVICELTTENGRIVLDTDDSTATLVIDATVTGTFTPALYYYDLEFVNGTDVYREMQGIFAVDSEVTQ